MCGILFKAADKGLVQTLLVGHTQQGSTYAYWTERYAIQGQRNLGGWTEGSVDPSNTSSTTEGLGSKHNLLWPKDVRNTLDNAQEWAPKMDHLARWTFCEPKLHACRILVDPA